MTRASAQRGFTLLELLIALAIVGALLAIAFGGLRVAMAAWTQGEDRAEVHQHLRSIAVVLGRAVGAAYPYRAAPGLSPEPVVLFQGTADRVELVTQAPPFPGPTPVAFTAVVIALESADEGPALVVRQRVLPNREPFGDAAAVLRDPVIHRLTFSYLDAQGAWQDEWEGGPDSTLPRAVRITVSTRRAGQAEATLPLTVALRTVTP